MVRNYGYALCLTIIFCLIAACGGNGVSSQNNASNHTQADVSTDEDASNDTSEDSGDTTDLCALVDCIENSTCDSESGQCACNEGYTMGEDDDGVAQCVASLPADLCEQVECTDHATCDSENGECVCNEGYFEGEDDNGEMQCVDQCVTMRCGPNSGGCEAGVCLCKEGYENVGGLGCQPVATGLCKDRETPCQEDATCNPETGECVCDFGEKEGEGAELDVPVCKGVCDAMRCSANSTCDPDLKTCVCDEGFEPGEGEDGGCKAIDQGLCGGIAVKLCPTNASCDPNTGDCKCDDLYMDVSEQDSDQIECRNVCEMMRCMQNSTCDPEIGQCVCNEGFIMVEGQGCQRI